MNSSSVFGIYVWSLFGPAYFFVRASMNDLRDVADHWQTLITGLLAIFAAYLAARPGWQQLDALKLQTATLRREVLINRVNSTQRRQEKTREIIETITADFSNHYLDAEGEPIDVDPEWAFWAEGIVDDKIEVLLAQQETSFDGQEIDVARSIVVSFAQDLSICLSTIRRPFSHELADPEWQLDEAEIAKALKAAKHAKTELGSKVWHVRDSANKLHRAYLLTLSELRTQIREIDELLSATKGMQRRRDRSNP